LFLCHARSIKEKEQRLVGSEDLLFIVSYGYRLRYITTKTIDKTVINIPTGTPIPNDNPKLESSSSGGVGLVTTFLSSMSTDITNIHTSTSSLYTSKSETVDTSTSSYHTSTAKTVDTSTNVVTKPTPPEDDDSSFGLSFGIGVPVGILSLL
jgi:hypothetical protein